MDSPTDGADWVVTIFHYNLLKKNCFIACSGPVVFSFTKEILFHFIVILD
jgi:hypothetical protein